MFVIGTTYSVLRPLIISFIITEISAVLYFADFMCAHVTGWDHFEANEVGFKELYQMFRLVTEQVGQEPIIIDADDLLKQPGVH